MSGTLEGGKKAAITNKAKYGPDFYAVQGSKGGKKGRTGGFWYAKHITGDIDFIKESGRRGGTKSRRKSTRKTIEYAAHIKH